MPPMRSCRRPGPTLSFRAVAAAAGVNHRALYRHYADRETLLDALAARGYGRLADAIQGSLAGAADPAAAFIAAYAGFALGKRNSTR